MNEDTDLGRAARLVLNVSTDNGQLAGQVIGHGVCDDEKGDESGNLGHLVLLSEKISLGSGVTQLIIVYLGNDSTGITTAFFGFSCEL